MNQLIIMTAVYMLFMYFFAMFFYKMRNLKITRKGALIRAVLSGALFFVVMYFLGN
jgi:hypothetical protein